MKKLFAIIVIMIMCFSLCSCNGNNEDVTTTTTRSDSVTTTKKTNDPMFGLTDELIDMIVADALYDEVGSQFATADPGSCTYKVNKTVPSGKYVYVYGSLTLYDQYGRITTGRRDGSGTPYRSFEVKIDEDWDVVLCEIIL